MKYIYLFLFLTTLTNVFAVPTLKTWHENEGKPEHKYYIEAKGEFKLTFVRSMNYGLSEWYDLKNDTEGKRNLTKRTLGKHGNGFQGALFNQVMNPYDVIAHIGLAGTTFKDEPKFLKIIEESEYRVIVETKCYPMLSSKVAKEYALITRYAIYPTGRIYITNTMLFEQDYTVTEWRHATVSLGDPLYYAYGTKEKGEIELIGKNRLRKKGANWTPGSLKNYELGQPKWNTWLIKDNTEDELIIDKQLAGRDPLKTGPYILGSHQTHYGWLRGNDNTNPHSWSSKMSRYAFVYWDKNTPAPYTDYTKASLLIAPHPENSIKNTASMHGWVGFKRYYFGTNDHITRKKGESITLNYLIQLGTENSKLLPNIINKENGGPYAENYLTKVEGLELDKVTGVYRIADLEKEIELGQTLFYPFFEFDKVESLSLQLNGENLSRKDYKVHQKEKGSCIQLHKNLQKGDRLKILTK